MGITGWDRIKAACALEKTDRVAICPALYRSAAGALQGMTQAETQLNPEKALDAMLKTYDDFGGWDALYTSLPDTETMWLFYYRSPIRWKLAGRELPEDYQAQVFETEALSYDEYDRIIEEGFDKFFDEEYIFRITDWTPEEKEKKIAEQNLVIERAATEWQKRGVQDFFGSGRAHPFFNLSIMRSLEKFTEDLYFKPDKVEQAIKKMTDEMIPRVIQECKDYGVNYFSLNELRASTYFYPLEIFERFWMPYTLQIVDALWSEGIVTNLLVQTNWDKNLPYFKHFPKGAVCLGLDGSTNIFEAKKLLDGWCSFHGDVPPQMVALEKPETVANYTKKLIDEVGYNGGLILNIGCEMPPDTKPENFRAFLETGKNYEASKRQI
ncbi:uroporphyrinogen-III decarboxylase [Desulfosporosinus orientis DSM 765]|uniref:Uroporphyrinogen-III decarboxylase n=1 Tax=Desulfosporosinus orientis (strain ATCC 19365 / DSM 765 / NCIMB 8382 / VKM B-1628 / Singapore I) TaxID=768706 RepID=G7W6W6_DESOD|nr:uroporphyrinogen decarboxylase family protein [Desulfosporosinus orientis]AET69823.1 uroporphyrinogen-III decarboxylase [Desulfosporosinus orientis DSM 765]